MLQPGVLGQALFAGALGRLDPPLSLQKYLARLGGYGVKICMIPYVMDACFPS